MDYMSFKVEGWAKEWAEKERANGEACIEIKVSNGNHYVYRSTSTYDRSKKGAKKVSEYMGSLKLVDGKAVYTPKKKDLHERPIVRSIHETGPLRLLDRCAGNMYDVLRRRFPNEYDSLYALAMIRCIDRVPLKRASDMYDKYEPVRGMLPPMSPNTLSKVLRSVGTARDEQLLVFKDLASENGAMAFDLTEFFSSSGELTLAETGRNPEHDDRRQINIVMTCDTGTGEPNYVRATFGSVRDVKTVFSSLEEMKKPAKGTVFLGDRGIYSESNVAEIKKKGMCYAFPVKRDSGYYEEVELGDSSFFFWKGRVIKYGKSKSSEGKVLYLFHNDEMEMQENRNACRKLADDKMEPATYDKIRPRMGRMLVISDMDVEPEWIYDLYKHRDRVEKRFRTIFDNLEADATYLSENEQLFGHLFVTYLSLKIVSSLENLIRKAGLSDKYSVADVLLDYSKAYAVTREDRIVDYEVPARLEKLDSDLGVGIFPILRS